MRASTPVLLALLACGLAFADDPPKAPLPQRIAYVGKPEGDRARQYTAFLKGHFARVEALDRDRVDPARIGKADVVILDWSQADVQDANGRFEFPYPERNLKSPLGPRGSWSRPTVLVGSAGHLLAACWQIHGGSG